MKDFFAFSAHFFVYRTLDEDALDLIAGAGFKNLEVWGMVPHFPYRKGSVVAGLGKALEKRGIRPVSIHFPLYRHRDEAVEKGLFIGLGHPDPGIRTQAKKEMAACLKATEALGIGQVVIHGDIHPEDRRRSKEFLMEGLEWLLTSYNGRVTIENILWETAFPLALGETVTEFRDRFPSLGRRLGICLDVGHAAATGTLTPDLISLKGMVFEVHLSDTHPPQDEHLIPGEGDMDWKEVCSLITDLEVDGPLVMEIRAREPYREIVPEVARSAKDLVARWLR